MLVFVIFSLAAAFPFEEKEDEEEHKKYFFKKQEEPESWKDEEDDYFKKKWDSDKFSKHDKYDDGWKPVPKPLLPFKKFESYSPKMMDIGYKSDYEEKKPKEEDMKKEILEDVDKLIPKVYVE